MPSGARRHTCRHRQRDSSSKRVRNVAPSSSTSVSWTFIAVLPSSPGIDRIVRQSNSTNSTTSPIDASSTPVNWISDPAVIAIASLDLSFHKNSIRCTSRGQHLIQLINHKQVVNHSPGDAAGGFIRSGQVTSHGLNTSILMSSKCRTFLVTNTMPRDWTIAEIWPSDWEMGRPAARQAATLTA